LDSAHKHNLDKRNQPQSWESIAKPQLKPSAKERKPKFLSADPQNAYT
jgi:hypothetical protein